MFIAADQRCVTRCSLQSRSVVTVGHVRYSDNSSLGLVYAADMHKTGRQRLSPARDHHIFWGMHMLAMASTPGWGAVSVRAAHPSVDLQTPTAPKGKWPLCCNECRWLCKMQHSRYWSLVNYKGWDCPDSPIALGFARDLRVCVKRSKWIGLGIVVQTSILIFPRQSPCCTVVWTVLASVEATD